MTDKHSRKNGRNEAKNRHIAAYAILGLVLALSGPVSSQTTTTTLPEYHQVMTVQWLLAPWTFWTSLFPAPLNYLPIIVFVMLVGFMSLYKNRTILIPAILLILFLTTAGPIVVAAFGLVGFVILGVIVLALVVAYQKIFY
jgi:hypothetical protein